ncbi:MAG: hypothetical protein HY317_03455 [Acidobacteria bacterium]|nr:hypothetical protein [Acidobacteriota bacterium]
MENSFDVLEEKVRKAADLVKRLRKENHALDEDLVKARARLAEAEKRLSAIEGERSGGARDADALKGEVKTLRHEREEIRTRIARLVEVLEGLD